jgi:hypothetical protein
MAVPELVDWDADGDQDLVVATEVGPTWLYVNEGGTGAWNVRAGTVIRDTSGTAISPYRWGGVARFADLTGDGKFDLLLSTQQRVRLYTNVGTASAPAFSGYKLLQGPTGDLQLPSYAWFFDVTDWNGDGLQDLVVQEMRSFYWHNVSLYQNVGTAVDARFAAPVRLRAGGVEISHATATQPVVADLDNDGLKDLLVGNEGGETWYYLNRGTRTTPELAAGQRFLTVHGRPVKVPGLRLEYWGGACACLQVADYDGDGTLDLIIGSSFGEIKVHRGNATATDLTGPRALGWHMIPSRCASPVGQVRIAFDEPLNASTLSPADISVAGPHGPIPFGVSWDSSADEVVIDIGAHTWPVEMQFTIGPWVNDLSGNAMDQDGDGVGGETSDACRFSVSEVRAYEKPWPIRTHSGILSLEGDVAHFATDWDADGDTDFLIGRGTGEVEVLINDGGAGPHEFRDPAPVLASGVPVWLPLGARRPCFVDLNGDGLRDLLIQERGEPCKVRLYLNSGTSSQPVFTAHSYLLLDSGTDVELSGTPAPFSVADWNGDGLLDLLVGEFNGFVGWLRNTGTASSPRFAETAWISDADRIHSYPHWPYPVVHDLNGDGVADLTYGINWGHLNFFVNHGSAQVPYLDQFFFAYRCDGGLLQLPYQRYDPAYCDLNNDGATDVVCVGGSKDFWVCHAWVGQPDVLGPRVWRLDWRREFDASGRLVRIDAVFDEALLAASVGLDDIVVTGPAGPIAPTGVTVSGSTVSVYLAPQAVAGTYTLRIGPNISDQAGNLMDQDADMVRGEQPDDVFTGSYTLVSPCLPTLAIKGGAACTNSTAATLTTNCSSCAEVHFRNDPGDWSAWAACSASRPWTLPPGDGVKRVCMQGRDASLVESLLACDEILLDTTPPSNVSVRITAGAACTDSQNVTLSLAANGAAQMRFRNEAGAWSPWEAFATSKAWTLSSGRGMKTVGFQCRDACGNQSAEATDTIRIPAFEDVGCSNQWWAYVEALARQAITSGCSASPPLYCPDRSVNRGQMAKFLCLAAGKSWLDATTPTFADVPRGHTFYGYIERLADGSSWGGSPPTSGCRTVGTTRYFCPNDSVTRGQMAKFLCVATAKTPLNRPTPTFADVPIGHPFYGWIERLAGALSWGGNPPTTGCRTVGTTRYFCPNDTVTRAQMAKLLVLAFGLRY